MIKFVTKKNYMAIAQEVVDKHMVNLFNELDIPPVSVTLFPGFCKQKSNVAGRYMAAQVGMFFSSKYMHARSYIEIFPKAEMFYHIPLKKSNMTISIRKPVTVNEFRRLMLVTLAHEIRHGYQYYYNVHMDELDKLINYIPYQYKEEEIDAREYSEEYANRMKEVI